MTSFTETLIALVVGGLLTGVVTLGGVWITATKAAEAAAAADARRDAAEHRHWMRDQKLAAYSAFIAEVDAWPDDVPTDAFVALAKQVGAAYTHVKLVASPEVEAAASVYFNRQMDVTRAVAHSTRDQAALLASAQNLREAYVALLQAMRREIGVDSR